MFPIIIDNSETKRIPMGVPLFVQLTRVWFDKGMFSEYVDSEGDVAVNMSMVENLCVVEKGKIEVTRVQLVDDKYFVRETPQEIMAKVREAVKQLGATR